MSETYADIFRDLCRPLEPLPTDEFRRAEPAEYARLLRTPNFLCIRAVALDHDLEDAQRRRARNAR